MKTDRIFSFCTAGAAAALLAGCGPAPKAGALPPRPVTVSPPVARPFTEYLEETGTAAASRTVDLVARVQGYLKKIYFQDGTFVDQDAPLFLIEPDQYEARVALNQAQLVNAQAEYERQQRLIVEQATSQSNVENRLAQRDAAAANTRLAQIDLGYTRIAAPFSGRLGRHLVDEGNLVGNGTAAKLVTIEQVDPIYAYFNVNERDVLRLRAAMAARHLSAVHAPVEAALQDDADYPFHGTLDFIDNGIDSSQGTLQLRAVFPNPERALFPGLFVKIRVPIGPAASELAVPDTAVGHDELGAYVMLVDSASVVVQRRVKTGQLAGGMRAVRDGLAPEDRVIVDGLVNASPGSRVQVTTAGTKLP